MTVLWWLNQTASFGLTLSGPVLLSDLISLPSHSQLLWLLLFSPPSRVRLLATPWTAACQASLFFSSPQSLLRFMCIESVTPSDYLILCRPLLPRPHSFPASGCFPSSQLFTSGGQASGAAASASVFPINIQDWFPLGLTGLISL